MTRADPLNLPDDGLYYTVDGIPVTLGHESHPGCMAWDELPPRPFRVESLQRNGWRITVLEFRRLVDEALGPPETPAGS